MPKFKEGDLVRLASLRNTKMCAGINLKMKNALKNKDILEIMRVYPGNYIRGLRWKDESYFMYHPKDLVKISKEVLDQEIIKFLDDLLSKALEGHLPIVPDIKKVESLNYRIRFNAEENAFRVGCQKISAKDALEIAEFIEQCVGK